MDTFMMMMRGLIGEPLTRTRSGYGGAISLHLGELIPSASGRERGSWVVTCWGGDLIITNDEEMIDSRTSPHDLLMRRLDRLNGECVVDLMVHDQDLGLTFESGARVRLVPDPAFDGDAWTISLPTEQTIAVDSAGEWHLEK